MRWSRQWPAAGVTGLRIDHPDGLVDPAEYLERLRAIAPDQWITVEKILEAGEQLPADWPVSGTTGYDAMREVNGVFVDPDAEPELTDALPAADRGPSRRSPSTSRSASGWW